MAMMSNTASSAGAEPITADWKISEVLKAHPALLDVLIDTSPEFKKLRNPILRRVQSKLVTVGQAAGIAGVDPAYLVRTLNSAAGLAVPDVRPAAAAPENAELSAEPPWVGSANIAEDLDVRPFQQRGEEPFSAIMAATRNVPHGKVFRLRNTFEPTPLYEVLRQRGFEHWSRQLGENDWEILFFNSGLANAPKPAADESVETLAPGTWDEPTSTLTIDVSELVPPEPMIRILTALEELPAGATLLVHHVRRPMHLYPRLDELGYRHETRDLAPGRVEVLIEKTADTPTGNAE